VPARHLAKLVAKKEFCDNALDSAAAAGNAGAIEIEVDESGNLIVIDRGTGIPDAPRRPRRLVLRGAANDQQQIAALPEPWRSDTIWR
jgi:hypothetical protein